MKSSKLKIILSVILILLLVSVGAVWYLVSTKVKPEEIRKIAIEEISKVFPNAQVELGEIDLGIGATINLDAKKFLIKYKLNKKEVELFKVNTLSAKIPLWTILMGGGAVDLIVDNPEVKYLSYGKNSLWDLAMNSEQKAKKIETKKSNSNKNNQINKSEKTEETNIVVPLFIANSSLNLLLRDINVEYGQIAKPDGKISINKLMVKNLGLKKDAAYEINSRIVLGDNTPSKMSLNSLLIGEFNLKSFLDNGSIKSKALLTLSDIKMSSLKGNFPEIKNDIDLELNKSGNVKVNLSGEFEKSNYKLSVNMNNKKIIVDNLLFNLILAELKQILPEAFVGVNPGKSTLKINGKVILENEKMYPDINYALSEEIRYSNDVANISINSKGKVTDKRFTSTTIASMFGGSIDTAIAANFDLNSKKTDFQDKLKNYTVNLDISNLNFEKPFLQKVLYEKKEQAQTTSNAPNTTVKNNTEKNSQNKNDNAGVPLLPNGTININAKKINLGGKSLQSIGKIITNRDSVAVKNFKFVLDKGEAVINTNSKLYKNLIKTNFNTNLKNVNITSFDGVIPAQYSGTSGSFSGKINGDIKQTQKLDYDVNIALNAVNGEIKGIDLKPYLEKVYALAKKIPSLDKKIDPNKKVDVKGNFKVFKLNGRFKPTHYALNSTEFIGLDNLIEFKANGNIYPDTKKEGKVYSDIVENKYLSDNIEKYAGTRNIPVLFKGSGLELNPDYEYTVKKLTKKVLKKNKAKVKKKVKKKAKEEIKKGIDKLFKGKEKKKIDKLLKGLF